MSDTRQASAEQTKKNILAAAKKLFKQKGFDKTTVAAVAALAGVSAPSVYALYKSKEGLLRELVNSISFGEKFQKRIEKIINETSAVESLKTVAEVARNVYESEKNEMDFLRGAEVVAPSLKKIHEQIERQRFDGQKLVVERLFDENIIRPEIDFADARDVLLSLTSRDLYRQLVVEKKWSPDKYQKWLTGTLLDVLVKPDAITFAENK